MRQWAAMSIVFYSYKYIRKKELKKYLLLILIASLFHKTALLMIFLYILQNINISKKVHILLFGISFFFEKIFVFIIFNIKIPIISYYKGYIIEKIGLGGAKMYYIILGIYIILLLHFLFLKKRERKLEKIYTISLIGCFIYTSLISLGHLGIRIGMYFLIFSLILIDRYTSETIYKIGIFLLSLLLISSLLISDVTRQNIRSEYVPYQTIFNKRVIKGE